MSVVVVVVVVVRLDFVRLEQETDENKKSKQTTSTSTREQTTNKDKTTGCCREHEQLQQVSFVRLFQKVTLLSLLLNKQETCQ